MKSAVEMTNEEYLSAFFSSILIIHDTDVSLEAHSIGMFLQDASNLLLENRTYQPLEFLAN